MILPIFPLITCLTLAGAPAENPGVIAGTVVNASQGNSPVPECKVVLRARLENQYVVLAEATADHWGRFQFGNLLVGEYYEYLPGANRDGVHYPGAPVHITIEQPQAAVEVSVCDSIAAPSPLVIRRHEIRLRPEEGVLYVTESLLVDNPSSTCYVGQAPQEGAEPVTLQLSIPPEFERATFEEEYFGRHFAVLEGKLSTSLPWPPGKKELKFTYVIRNAEISRNWQRQLDYPCSDVCVRVQTSKPEEITCNLAPATLDYNEKGEKGVKSEAVFGSTGRLLPAGYMMSVDLKHLPVPWMTYARWMSLTALIGIIMGASVFAIRRRELASHSTTTPIANQDPPKNISSEHAPKHELRCKHGKIRTTR